jgi:hypothetical protein
MPFALNEHIRFISPTQTLESLAAATPRWPRAPCRAQQRQAAGRACVARNPWDASAQTVLALIGQALEAERTAS